MRLVFAGTPEFSVQALDALHAAGHQILAVYTQPDRPAGRGRKLTPTAVAERATALGLPVHKPLKLDAAAQVTLRELAPEVMVVVAYGLLLPQAVLDIPTHGCLNIHASLLPRWRGAAPIQRALEAGDAESGVTIMRMDAGLDTGPMLLEQRLPLHAQMTGGDLHDALAPLGSQLIVQALERLAQGTLNAQTQPTTGVTYARKLSKEEARIDWTQPAVTLARRIQAFNPAPGCWSELDGERLRLLRAQALPDAATAAPGTIMRADAQGLLIACGQGCLNISELQFAGGRAVSAAQAAAGRALAGKCLQ